MHRRELKERDWVFHARQDIDTADLLLVGCRSNRRAGKIQATLQIDQIDPSPGI